MADHFPRSIPKDPTRARIHFYYSFFGQGGTKRGELWMKPDPGQIDRLYAEFDRIKVNVYRIHQADKNYWINLTNKEEFRSTLDFFTMKEGNPATTRSLEWHQQTAPITEDFTVFTLDCGKATHWDRGAAISKKRNEILYFAHINYAF